MALRKVDETERIQATIDRSVFREAFGRVPMPVAVVTANDGEHPVGTTVSSFCSLSADPPLVLVALDLDSDTLQTITETRRFGLNVLARGHEDLAAACALKGDAKRDALDHHPDRPPRVSEAAVWMDCSVREILPGGDHVMVVGLVNECEVADGDPLLYHQRGFTGVHRP